MKKRFTRWTEAALVLLCLACLLLPTAVQASAGQTASLRLRYVQGSAGSALSGMQLRLYRVAELKAGVYHVTDGFARAGVDLNRAEPDWPVIAETLAAYAQAEADTAGAALQAAGETDGQGYWSVRSLPLGLYLVTGEALRVGDAVCTPMPFLLTLPYLNREDGIWSYDPAITIDQKYTRTGDGPAEVSISVEKKWQGDTEERRPERVSVTLLQNGKPYETVELSRENGWSHRWYGLNGSAYWTLSETVPEGYTAEIGRDASGTRITFTVVNTGRPEDPPGEETPAPSPEPTPEPTPSPVPTPEPSEPVPDRPDEPQLPQTGTRRRLICVLAAGGGALTFGGLLLLSRGKRRA